MYATCETEGCNNSWIPIPVTGELTVICGVCDNPITNITDIQPEEGRALPEWILQMLPTRNSTN